MASAAQEPRLAPAHSRNFDPIVRRYATRERRTVAQFQLLGLGGRRSQPSSDVIGQLGAAKTEHGRVGAAICLLGRADTAGPAGEDGRRASPRPSARRQHEGHRGALGARGELDQYHTRGAAQPTRDVLRLPGMIGCPNVKSSPLRWPSHSTCRRRRRRRPALGTPPARCRLSNRLLGLRHSRCAPCHEAVAVCVRRRRWCGRAGVGGGWCSRCVCHQSGGHGRAIC